MTENESNNLSNLQKSLDAVNIKSALEIIKETTFVSEISQNQVRFTRLWNIFINYTGLSITYKIPVSGPVILSQFSVHSGVAFTITFNNAYTVSLPAGFFPMNDLAVPLPDATTITITLASSGTISGIISGIRVS